MTAWQRLKAFFGFYDPPPPPPATAAEPHHTKYGSSSFGNYSRQHRARNKLKAGG